MRLAQFTQRGRLLRILAPEGEDFMMNRRMNLSVSLIAIVLLCGSMAEAERAIDEVLVRKAFGSAGATIVIQELLEGTEISLHALCDGRTARLFPTSQDHKRALEGDQEAETVYRIKPDTPFTMSDGGKAKYLSRVGDKVRIEQKLSETQTIWANKNKLIHVCVNLLQNSLDALKKKTFTLESPTIWIEGRVEPGKSLLTIAKETGKKEMLDLLAEYNIQ